MIEESFELSPLQEGMLYHALGAGLPGVDVEHVSCILDEELEPDILERSWNRVVARHAILRTCFRLQGDGRPIQDVHGEAQLSIDREDWRDAPPETQDERWGVLVAADRKAGFDVFRPPLMRLMLVTLGGRRHRLLWSFHHALLDGRAFPLVLREVFDDYDAERAGRPLRAPALPRPYRDLVHWLREKDLRPAEDYWRRVLGGFGAPTHLGLPRPEAPSRTDALPMEAGEFRLSQESTGRLRIFARDHELTLGTIAHGAWALLLHHYTSERDIVFGSTVTLRRGGLEGAEDMVGLLINTLPLRVSVEPDTPVAQWLQALRRQQIEAREHAATPLVRIQACSDVTPGKALFDSIVVYDHAGLDTSLRQQRPGWTSRRFDYAGQTSFPLTLLAYGEDELHLRLEYDLGALDEGAAGRLLAHLIQLLEEIPDAADRPLRKLPRLTNEERRLVLKEWNRTDREYPLEMCLHELIGAQAAREPHRVAVAADGDTISFEDLEARSNQLARALRGSGVATGALVGVAMERSVELIVGLLGTLKAGGAYVPLDPAYPRDRLSFMLQDSSVQVLLTQERLRDLLPDTHAPVLELDREWPRIERHSAGPLAPVATSRDLAYVIYTSGSTGRPKGAMNTHRAIVNRLLWMQEEYGLDHDDRVLQKTPISFDVSVWELFWPLLAGARLVMARPGGHRDPEYLVRTIVDEKITTLHFVPAMLQAFLEADDVERCGSVRRVICSGEALPAELRDRFFERLGCELHNLYGPTEAAVDVTHWECRRDDRRKVVPIGRPVANTRIYVLDEQLQPVPVGAPGELHVGGVQVGEGYLRRPELTEERFIPDPFATDPGGRLYKTGDRARHQADGSLEYLGRIDSQVKIRGFRIEPGEIEAVLSEHPAVREVVVVAREDRPGDRRLVAYLVADEDSANAVPALRGLARDRLPDFMVPSAFVFLPEVPLTPSGKVDRRALPAPDIDRRRAGAEYTAPASTVESTLAEIWGSVLGRTSVGVEDNFFDVGGDSLLLIQVVARVRDKGFSLTPLTVFRHPTVRALAEHLGGKTMPAAPGGHAVRERAQRQRVAIRRRKRAPRGNQA